MSPRTRVAVAVLALAGFSTAGFDAWITREGMTTNAVIPTKGDVPTIGHGSTHYENGQSVRMGDRITPARARTLARNLATADAKQLAASLTGVELYPEEWDEYLDWVGQYGITKWRTSSMRARLLAGDYAGACNALLLYKFAAGYDCSTPGNKRCGGVWTRQLDRNANCLAAQ